MLTRLTHPTLEYAMSKEAAHFPSLHRYRVAHQLLEMATSINLIFINAETKTTFSVDYPSILIHAIARAGSDPLEPRPCIYCQLDGLNVRAEGLPATSNGGGSTPSSNGVGRGASNAALTGTGDTREDEDEFDDDDDGEPTYEMRIVPDDSGALEAIFLALSECAALHPDMDVDPDDGDDDGWVYAEDDIGDLDEARQAALAHLDTVFEGGGIRPNDAVGHPGAPGDAIVTVAPAAGEAAANSAEAAAARFEDASEDGHEDGC
ncbi:hypothetical protein HK405_009638 [Cladochytrium tenue]|nr:hypothetical protein HK405_009638 [Cladochytrium tenue]